MYIHTKALLNIFYFLLVLGYLLVVHMLHCLINQAHILTVLLLILKTYYHSFLDTVKDHCCVLELMSWRRLQQRNYAIQDILIQRSSSVLLNLRGNTTYIGQLQA